MPIPVSHHLPALCGTESLWGMGAEDVGGIIILGSGSSVHDELIWQHQLREWLAPHISAGTPFMGFCYGHQLLAHMAGGTVGLMGIDGQKQQGLRHINFTDSRLWGKAQDGSLVVSHREEVKSIPADWRVVGTSDGAAVEAMEHLHFPQWTFQAHPEATPQFLSHQELDESIQVDTLKFGWSLIDGFAAHLQSGRL